MAAGKGKEYRNICTPGQSVIRGLQPTRQWAPRVLMPTPAPLTPGRIGSGSGRDVLERGEGGSEGGLVLLLLILCFYGVVKFVWRCTNQRMNPLAANKVSVRSLFAPSAC